MKKILVLILTLVLIFGLCACNKQVLDLDYHFNYAIIFLPDGNKIEGQVTSWNDYEDSDMIQVKIENVIYLTHASNVILEYRPNAS